MDEIAIRGERPGDEEAINIVNCRAFRHADEGQIVDDMRVHYPRYDRRFSAVAWHGETAVGPVAVCPNFKNRG